MRASGVSLLTIPGSELLAEMEKETRPEASRVTVVIFTDLWESQLIGGALLEQDRGFRSDDELGALQETFQEERTELIQQWILLVDGKIVRIFADVFPAGATGADLTRPVRAHVDRSTLAVLVPTYHERE